MNFYLILVTANFLTKVFHCLLLVYYLTGYFAVLFCLLFVILYICNKHICHQIYALQLNAYFLFYYEPEKDVGYTFKSLIFSACYSTQIENRHYIFKEELFFVYSISPINQILDSTAEIGKNINKSWFGLINYQYTIISIFNS